MKISIIIPVHNAGQTLVRCVESLTVQGHPDLELILIENNSSDDSWAVCRKLEQQHRSVVCLQTAQAGVSAARNLGLRHASGDVIGFVDADDTVKAGALSTITGALERHPDCAVVAAGFEKSYPDGRTKAYPLAVEVCWPFKKLLHHVLYDSKISGYLWNKFFRRELLEGVAFREDLSHSEDTHFVIHALMARRDGKAVILPDVIYTYYQQPDSATAQLGRMFDDAGRLKLIVAAKAILEDFKLGWYDSVLTRRLIFSMASSQYLRFKKELEPCQAKYMKKEMRGSVLYYLATFFVAPLETVKRLLRLLGV